MPQPRQRLGDSASPACLLIFTASTWYTVTFYLELPQYELYPQYTFYYLVIFHILLFNVILNLYLTRIVDPGKVPKDFTFVDDLEAHTDNVGDQSSNTEISGSSQTNLTNNTSGNLTTSSSTSPSDQSKKRFCTHCDMPKPERTHHCRKCGRCILKMDHHCPWTNCCVGWGNYKYFLLLISYGTTTLAFYVPTQFYNIWAVWDKTEKEYSDWYCIVTWLTGCMFLLSGISLCLFHAQAVLTNMTTLEYMEKSKMPNFVNWYDINPQDNFVQVMGDNPFLWPLPTRYGIEGEGTRFPKRTDIPEWMRNRQTV